MAYTAGGLSLISSVNGFGLYRYDSTDDMVTVEAAGYFNNKDDDLNLAVGDEIHAYNWSTVRSGTLSEVMAFAVTNVVSNDAAASAGAVNIAEIFGAGTGALSST